MTDQLANPFLLEAVATYGDTLRTVPLRYMREAERHLSDYLAAYQNEKTRYGGTVPLRGAHGSGKTHLLIWLAQARERRVSQPIVLYAKVDRASFFDLFSQLMKQLTQERLQQRLGEAATVLARDQVAKAAITSDLQKRINVPDDLVQLGTEGNIDRSELIRLLHEKLKAWMERSPDVSPEIALALVRIDSPALGERAYQWLQGKRVDGLEELGLAHYLGELAQNAEGSSVPDLAAIDALETIAALHQFANRPLVLLIDQLEVMFKDVDAERRQTLASLIKKLMEQLGRQNVLTFITGTDDAWDALPRDVTPRMRVREPLRVGVMGSDELIDFMTSFTEGTAKFSQGSIDTIQRLSGGNLREIIRIGYHAFKRLDGALDKATEQDLLSSAGDSGTVADRERIALGIVDRVFESFGDISRDLDVGGEIILNRVLRIGPRPSLALVTLKATDQISEVRSAKRIPAIADYLKTKWPSASLIVVTVGYASPEVASLLGPAGVVLEFDEKGFANQLRTQVIDLLARHDREAATAPVVAQDPSLMRAITDLAARIEQRDKAGPAAGPDRVVIDTLRQISSRLDELESRRELSVGSTIASFAERTAERARPEIRQDQVRTKWDLIDLIEQLDYLLQLGVPVSEERPVIRSILVANEAFLHNALIDKLGGIYLDLLSPQYFHASTKDRRDVIRSMRYVLRGLNGVDAFATRPARNALLVGAATCVVALLVFGALYFSDFRVVWPIVLAQGGLLGLFTGIGAFVFFRQRMKRVLGPWSRLHPPA